MLKDIMWVEKYRPKEFHEVIGLPEKVRQLNFKNLTHLLFVGKQGTGKTTVALIIARKIGADLLEINAADERGIDAIRTKVKGFAQKASFGRKVILLDEADGITSAAQDSLRRIMELAVDDTIFILTANYVNRIIEPIQSRCDTIMFGTPEKSQIVDRLKYICDMEGVKYKIDDLSKIVDIYYPDIRKSINALQNSVKNSIVDITGIKVDVDILEAVWILVNEKDYDSLRLLMKTESPEYNQVYSYLFDKVFDSDLKMPDKKDLLLKIADRMYRNSFVADQEINFLACCLELGDKL